jgi:hypothetical protein
MNKQTSKLATGLALLGVVALASGCAPTTPRWDSAFGASVRASLAAQVADPAAVRNKDPAAGMDGDAARAVHQRYVGDNASPPAPGAPMTSSTSGAK